MCGLSAVFALNKTGVSWEDVDIFKDLLIANSVRGMDGCGVIYVTDEDTWTKHKNEGGVGWVKDGLGPYSLFKGANWKEIDESIRNSRFLVGHNRWATVGKIDVKNNHPFEIDHITMVHNGTMRFIDNTDAKLEKFDVDSKALCKLLSIMPPDEAFKKAHGAIAAIWYDDREKKMKVYRNNERTLFYVKSGNKYYFASESGMLEWVLERRKKEKFMPVAVEPLTLYTFSHDEAEPDKVKIDPYNSRFTSFSSCEESDDDGWSWFGGRRSYQLPKQTTPVVVLPILSKKEKKKYKGLGEYFGVHVGDRLVLTPENREWNKDTKRYTLNLQVLANMTSKTGELGSMAEDAVYNLQCKLTDSEDLFKADLITATVASIVINNSNPADVRVFLANPQIKEIEGHA